MDNTVSTITKVQLDVSTEKIKSVFSSISAKLSPEEMRYVEFLINGSYECIKPIITSEPIFGKKLSDKILSLWEQTGSYSSYVYSTHDLVSMTCKIKALFREIESDSELKTKYKTQISELYSCFYLYFRIGMNNLLDVKKKYYNYLNSNVQNIVKNKENTPYKSLFNAQTYNKINKAIDKKIIYKKISNVLTFGIL